MTTELVTQQASTALTISDEQTTWTSDQAAALQHMGVEGASPGDLNVFFHVVKRTGLDPFARQIYMISRKSQGQVKQTIQTGIDGYRLIARRAADRTGDTMSTSAPEWAHEDGSWRPVWSSAWGMPLGARVVVTRAGQSFTAVALFEEYKQTKYNGDLTHMWSTRPGGQIAKCAEALALRMAFPQDLASVYVEDEMHQASNPERTQERARRVSAADFTPAPQAAPEPPPAPPEGQTIAEAMGEPAEDAAITDKTRARMFALLTEQDITDPDSQRQGMSKIVGREVESRSSLTEDEGQAIVMHLLARQQEQTEEPPNA